MVEALYRVAVLLMLANMMLSLHDIREVFKGFISAAQLAVIKTTEDKDGKA